MAVAIRNSTFAGLKVNMGRNVPDRTAKTGEKRSTISAPCFTKKESCPVRIGRQLQVVNSRSTES